MSRRCLFENGGGAGQAEGRHNTNEHCTQILHLGKSHVAVPTAMYLLAPWCVCVLTVGTRCGYTLMILLCGSGDGGGSHRRGCGFDVPLCFYPAVTVHTGSGGRGIIISSAGATSRLVVVYIDFIITYYIVCFCIPSSCGLPHRSIDQ